MDHKDKMLDSIAGVIIHSQLALNDMEQLKHTPLYKHELKRLMNPLIKYLLKTETAQFDKVYDENPDMVDKGAARVISAVKNIRGIQSVVFLGEIIDANNKSPESIRGIVKKILK